jgi:hypothetical protein
MSTYTEQQLGYAMGMVERRMNTVVELDKSTSQKQAVANHRSVCGAVKEVRKHHHNILQRIDNESAQHALQAGELLKTVEVWLGLSRTQLSKWGVSDNETRSIEEGVGI